MLLHGDELGRTQQGNNNAYCQDNELSWVDWSSTDDQLLAFTSRVIALRAAHPVFRRRRFFTGQSNADGEPDIAWLRPDGEVMASEDWSKPTVRALAVFLNGSSITELSPRGEQIEDDSFLMLLNPGPEPVDFTLPKGPFGEAWVPVLDTADEVAPKGVAAAVAVTGGAASGVNDESELSVPAKTTRTVQAYATVVFRRG
jgi:glycogen operon protein